MRAHPIRSSVAMTVPSMALSRKIEVPEPDWNFRCSDAQQVPFGPDRDDIGDPRQRHVRGPPRARPSRRSVRRDPCGRRSLWEAPRPGRPLRPWRSCSKSRPCADRRVPPPQTILVVSAGIRAGMCGCQLSGFMALATEWFTVTTSEPPSPKARVARLTPTRQTMPPCGRPAGADRLSSAWLPRPLPPKNLRTASLNPNLTPSSIARPATG